jgi:hypothetical protein
MADDRILASSAAEKRLLSSIEKLDKTNHGDR